MAGLSGGRRIAALNNSAMRRRCACRRSHDPLSQLPHVLDRLIGRVHLHHRELGVVPGGHPLVPEIAVDLEHLLCIAYTFRKQIADSLAGSRIPAMHGFSEAVTDGAMMSYSANMNDTRRQTASFVDRILKGARPGDLPFEQLTHMELVLNAKAAKAFGVAFPQTVLLRADRVIE